MAATPKYKVVCIGDGAVGKTCLLISYTKGEFPDEYIPTIFDNYQATIATKDGKSVVLDLWDTAGQEDYDHISVIERASFANVKQKWIQNVGDSESPGAKVVLVATKTDLRSDLKTTRNLAKKGKAPITSEEGRGLAAEIGADAYVECSALLGDGLKDCMQTAVTLSHENDTYVLGPSPSSSGTCCVVQ